MQNEFSIFTSVSRYKVHSNKEGGLSTCEKICKFGKFDDTQVNLTFPLSQVKYLFLKDI